jgi:HSP20 family protein
MFYATWKPATDLFYSGNRWLIRMELAGVSPAEIAIVAQRNLLTVRGRRRDLRVQNDYICHSLEISYTHFERSISLPAPIILASIKWECRDGLLHIRLSTQDYQ